MFLRGGLLKKSAQNFELSWLLSNNFSFILFVWIIGSCVFVRIRFELLVGWGLLASKGVSQEADNVETAHNCVSNFEKLHLTVISLVFFQIENLVCVVGEQKAERPGDEHDDWKRKSAHGLLLVRMSLTVHARTASHRLLMVDVREGKAKNDDCVGQSQKYDVNVHWNGRVKAQELSWVTLSCVHEQQLDCRNSRQRTQTQHKNGVYSSNPHDLILEQLGFHIDICFYIRDLLVHFYVTNGQEATSDYLLSKPLDRVQFLLAKLAYHFVLEHNLGFSAEISLGRDMFIV